MITISKNTKAFYNSEIPCDWSDAEFGGVFNLLKTFSFSREQLTSEPTNDKIRNIHYGDIHSTYENEILDLDIEKTIPYLLDGIIDLKSFNNESFPSLKDGDLIIADASEDYEGVCDCVELKNINGAKIVSGLHTFAARAKDEKIAMGYRSYVLQHEQVIRELRRIATGTSVYGVSKTNLSKVKIPLPPLPEQKAISQLLSKADAAIHTTEKLIAQKELGKKWLMQQLLTGNKRLKGFGGEWKEKRLGDFLKEREIKSDISNEFEILTSSRKGLFYQKDYFNKQVASENNEGYKVIQIGDFTYRSMSDDNTFVFNQLDFTEKGLISPAYSVFYANNINDKFLLYLLNNHSFKRYINKEIQGGTRTSFRFSSLREILLPIPLNDEQTAIARVLQAADKEISLLKAKAEKLREQKKGLMQQLLTGKVRLKI